MKIYRKNLSKDSLIYGLIIIPLLGDIFISSYSYKLNFENLTVFICVAFAINFPTLISLIHYNYLSINENELVIGNAIYTFLTKRYRNDSITKVLIGQRRSYAPYIQIFTRQKKSRKITLMLVVKSDFKKFIDDLEELHIPIELEDINITYNG